METKNGFTLIELLVVVAIIGILASVVLASLNSARAKARDAKRFSELKQLQTALEFYYADNGQYPGGGHYRSAYTGNCVNAGFPLWTTAGVFDATFNSKYMSSLPADPAGHCYTYTSVVSGWGPTAYRCLTSTSTIDPNNYFYFLTFETESNPSNNIYPGLDSASSTRRCILGPAK